MIHRTKNAKLLKNCLKKRQKHKNGNRVKNKLMRHTNTTWWRWGLSRPGHGKPKKMIKNKTIGIYLIKLIKCNCFFCFFFLTFLDLNNMVCIRCCKLALFGQINPIEPRGRSYKRDLTLTKSHDNNGQS